MGRNTSFSSLQYDAFWYKIRYKRLVWINFPFFFLCRTASFDNQRLKKKMRILFKKRGWKIWSICYKAVILHPLSREKCGWALKWWKEVEVERPFKKNFLKKTSKKFWWFKNSPYLCIRFRKESAKEEFFERFRYKQASSTRAYFK